MPKDYTMITEPSPFRKLIITVAYIFVAVSSNYVAFLGHLLDGPITFVSIINWFCMNLFAGSIWVHTYEQLTKFKGYRVFVYKTLLLIYKRFFGVILIDKHILSFAKNGEEALEWLENNTHSKFFIHESKDVSDEYIVFVNKKEALMFKMRWFN